MDPRLLGHYNRELQHVREMGAEFAREFPKVAGRLGLEQFDCADPYVERLLEGFAFLAARVQLKLDDEFPRFTQHLLQMVYPHYIAPVPSMLVAQFSPNLNEGALQKGYPIPRGTSIRAQIPKGEQTACEFTTAHDLQLWPLKLTQIEYLPNPSAVGNLGIPPVPGVKSGLRLRLQTTAGLKFNQLALNRLALFLRGTPVIRHGLYEQLLSNSVSVVVQPIAKPAAWRVFLDRSPVERMGFSDSQALLPHSPRSFHGYRLLQEFFVFPERYLFAEICGLQRAFSSADDAELDIVVLFNRVHPPLVNSVDVSHFGLHCVPAINLFSRRADRIHLSQETTEYHIVSDRTRPMDYEVYSVDEVKGYGDGNQGEQEFLPFYATRDAWHSKHSAYYSLRRQKRLLSSRQKRQGTRASYIGSELFISLVDANSAPFSSDLKQAGLKLRCSNRDLPLLMPLGAADTDLSLQIGAPVEAIRCIEGPTRPRPSVSEGETAWKIISHLSLNYLSLLDGDHGKGTAALRELLSLYADQSDPVVRKQIEGVVAIDARRAVRRLGGGGPIVFGRGLEIHLQLEDAAFEGCGTFLLGSVLEEFFARYVSINSFTETTLHTVERGEVTRWPVRNGRRHAL